MQLMADALFGLPESLISLEEIKQIKEEQQQYKYQFRAPQNVTPPSSSLVSHEEKGEDDGVNIYPTAAMSNLDTQPNPLEEEHIYE